MALRSAISIDKNWEFKQADKEDSGFRSVAQFPTNVHLDLLSHGLIPDPYIGKNEVDVQWVGEKEWIYRTTIISDGVPEGAKAVLACDGLDTFATMTLNGRVILESDNMFIPHRVDVTEALKQGSNELVIHFDSAYLRGWKLVEQYPNHKWGCWNGDNSRLAVRKAQYHWGWDWGPTLLTCGPWRPIYLEIYSLRLTDLHFDISVDKSLKSATVEAHASIEGSADKVRFDVFLEGERVASAAVDATSGEAHADFRIPNPRLWYPVRYGEHPLYTVQATLLDNDTELDSMAKRIGLRRAELVQKNLKGQPGKSFFFEINNIPIFCGGSNWIPADNFIPRITKERYYDWVKLVAEGNQCMIRVWGGGIYEEQAFYNACDELGILVWQDFMFGCGNYPAWPEFLDSVRREAQENIKLLRHHPCIVIWAGNNEDYQYQESEGLTYNFADKDMQGWLKTDFPARYIYEGVLARACDELIPGTHYHFGSPWGEGRDTHDATVGDIHQWNVWHGTQEKYQDFDKLVGRFVSEFGMEAFPSVKTIDAYLPQGKKDPDRYSQSSTVDFHNKATGHERRLALYLVENIRYETEPLEQFVYSTQLMQAECLSSAYRLWKRQWKGPGQEYCGGALVWQTNDCWPVTSWSICDYFLRPKLAYYAVKREMSPITVGIQRKQHRHPADKYTRVNIDVRTTIEIWGCNLTLKDITVQCVVKAWDVETGKETFSRTVADKVLLPLNQSTEITELDVPVQGPRKGEDTRTVIAAYLIQDGKQIARYVNWPEPLKYCHVQVPKQLGLQFKHDYTTIEVNADVPVKGFVLECEDNDFVPEDNGVDLVPGELMSIRVRGGKPDAEITWRSLGSQS